MSHDTGYYSYYTTHEDGLCCYDTAQEAEVAAAEASERCGEMVTVWTPEGEQYSIVGDNLPTHEEKCMDPETFGYEE